MVGILSTESLNLTIPDVGSFRFTEPIVFDVEMAGNGIVLGNAEADLFASGKTLDEALADLQSEIRMAWKEYATGDDSDMDGIARGYRKWLLDNVERRDRYGQTCVTDRTWHLIGPNHRRISWNPSSHPLYSPRPSPAIPPLPLPWSHRNTCACGRTATADGGL